MKILLTGANGYIGKRLLPVLINNGHFIFCCVRDVNRFHPPQPFSDRVQTIEVDLLDKESLQKIPDDIDTAYYLVHSMSSSTNYVKLEKDAAINFRNKVEQTGIKHVIYLGGIVNQESLSKHLSSRKTVETELGKGSYHFTALRAGIIIGSGSASFEIIRDLVEKLPIMIAPKWLKTKCQPIGIRDVITFLERCPLNPLVYNKSFDIGCKDILSYKELLLGYARTRKLKRKIFIVPVMTPKLSSYWLYFVTSTSYKLATALVSSMKIEVVCRNAQINQLLHHTPANYEESLRRTFNAIEANQISSSWKDSLISGRFESNISEFIRIPTFGCFSDKRTRTISNRDRCIQRLWSIGGDNGWYYANWLWLMRGFLDKLAGGVGLRRGRTHKDSLSSGDAIDFWRVLYANKEEGRLLLFAEMKLPGEAWLEFNIVNQKLHQIATFRPKGLLGRFYWYTVLPFHAFVFRGMINNLIKEQDRNKK